MATEEGARNNLSMLNWPKSQQGDPEDEASIYLIFHGLMCFAYNNTTGLCGAAVYGHSNGLNDSGP